MTKLTYFCFIFIGLTNVPASASNPIHSAAVNISHRPQISNNLNSQFGGGQNVSSNPLLANHLRAQLLQGIAESPLCLTNSLSRFLQVLRQTSRGFHGAAVSLDL